MFAAHWKREGHLLWRNSWIGPDLPYSTFRSARDWGSGASK